MKLSFSMKSLFVTTAFMALLCAWALDHVRLTADCNGLLHEAARARNDARGMWLMAESYRLTHVPHGPPLPLGMPYQSK
jgi:hypothetical protein